MSALTAQSNTVAAEVTEAAFAAEAGRIHELVADQLVLSQGRCVDYLLDLLNLTTEPAVRAELLGCLDAIRKLSAVEGSLFRATLDTVSAAFEVESAYAQFVLR